MSEPTSYKQERLEKQIDWHSKKARENKLRFRLYQIITLIASAIIPIINLVNISKSDTDYQIRIVSSIISATIVVVTGLTQLEKYQENWILYRTSAELLKKEKYFFENNTGEYSNLDEKEKNKLLVESVESIVSAETSKYFTIHQPSKKSNEKTG
jgi:Protein of unknown function (DUF4231)